MEFVLGYTRRLAAPKARKQFGRPHRHETMGRCCAETGAAAGRANKSSQGHSPLTQARADHAPSNRKANCLSLYVPKDTTALCGARAQLSANTKVTGCIVVSVGQAASFTTYVAAGGVTSEDGHL